MVSTRFTQCQAILRNNLRKSSNNDIVKIFYDTNCNTNIQYDQLKTTKDAIKQYRKTKEDRLTNALTTHSLVIKSVWKYGMKSAAEIWSKSIANLPKNIYNFSIRYINNSLANSSNMYKWGITASPLCLHCNNNQTLGHVVAGCESSLREKRYNYRHDSILLNLGRTLESIKLIDLYIDIPEFKNPSIITGENHRPDLIAIFKNKLYVLELTAGYETNIETNSKRKETHYKALMDRLTPLYDSVHFVNFSMGAIGVYGVACESLLWMFRDLGMSKREIDYVMCKICNICIRCTYYIFCCRNREWNKPELLYW